MNNIIGFTLMVMAFSAHSAEEVMVGELKRTYDPETRVVCYQSGTGNSAALSCVEISNHTSIARLDGR